MSRPPRIRAIIEATAAEHSIRVADILSPSRKAPHAAARRQAMAGCRALTMANGKPPSFPRIGAWFSRDHSTVCHALRRLAEIEAGQ